jgi:hypothetical protein
LTYASLVDFIKIELADNGRLKASYDRLKAYTSIKDIEKKRNVRKNNFDMFESDLEIKLGNLSMDTIDLVRKYE